MSAIIGTAVDLVAAVHTQAGAQVATGTIYCMARLSHPGDASDGYYWSGSAWEAAPASYPTATHIAAADWAYRLPAAAIAGHATARVDYTLTDDTTPASATTVCGGGSIWIDAEDPLATGDIPTAAAVSAQVQSDLATEIGYLDAAISSRATPAQITAAQTAIVGADGDTLETLSDQLDTVAVPTGSSMVTITVLDGDSAPVEGVKVSIYDSGNTAFKQTHDTDASGQVVTTLDDATYKVRMVRAGYTFTVPETLTVSGTTTDTYTATAWTPSAPSDPSLCVIYGWLTNLGGAPLTSAQVKIFARTPTTAGGYQLGTAAISTEIDATGYFEIEALRGASVKVICAAAGIDSNLTVPSAAAQDLATWSA